MGHSEEEIKFESENTACLEILCEYTKYLYIQEEERTNRFHRVTKTYIVYIGTTITALVAAAKWMGIGPQTIKLPDAAYAEYLFIILLLFALGFLSIAFVFSILVIKVWKTEKLCDPKKFVLETPMNSNKNYLLEKIIANYVVAASINSSINDSRGKLMSYSSLFYRIGLLFVLIVVITYFFVK